LSDLLKHYQEFSETHCYFWLQNAVKVLINQLDDIKSATAKVE